MRKRQKAESGNTLKIEVRPVSGLTLHEGNSKSHPDAQIATIAASITRFGFNDPIGITPDGKVIEGEGRLRAAQTLGMTDVPCLVLSGLTDRQIDMYRIAHNKIALTTSFDLKILTEVLQSVMGDDISLDMMGFDAESTSKLLDYSGWTGAAADPVAAPESATAPMLAYTIIWDAVDQKHEFEAALRAATNKGESLPDALLRLMEQAGVSPANVTTREQSVEQPAA